MNADLQLEMKTEFSPPSDRSHLFVSHMLPFLPFNLNCCSFVVSSRAAITVNVQPQTSSESRCPLAEVTMIGAIVSHYRFTERLGGGGMSQNGPRTICVSGCRFEDPAVYWREVLA